MPQESTAMYFQRDINGGNLNCAKQPPDKERMTNAQRNYVVKKRVLRANCSCKSFKI